MKIVPVRAVDLSIGPFWTEFRRERFRDNATFENAVRILFSHEVGQSFLNMRWPKFFSHAVGQSFFYMRLAAKPYFKSLPVWFNDFP